MHVTWGHARQGKWTCRKEHSYHGAVGPGAACRQRHNRTRHSNSVLFGGIALKLASAKECFYFNPIRDLKSPAPHSVQHHRRAIGRHRKEIMAFQDIKFNTVTGIELHGRLYAAASPGPGVVMCPGVSRRPFLVKSCRLAHGAA